jgi:hypothetical protein
MPVLGRRPVTVPVRAGTVLEGYETERRPVAANVVALTHQITRIAIAATAEPRRRPRSGRPVWNACRAWVSGEFAG